VAGNRTPNTPEVGESKIARMKVDELRRALRGRGVKGTDELKKPELVDKLIKAERKAAKGGRKKTTSRNDTPNTPDVSESKIARMKADDLRGRLKDRGVKGTADMKKPELVERFIKSELKAAKKSSGGKRSGKNPSSSLKYSQEITSTADRPERDGRSLVTTDHEVIRRWAGRRRAVPATVPGTEHDGHLGVLRFDFPGYYSGPKVTEVSWDDWFAAFDKRRLNFIYQERRSSGDPSNFFRLENPDE
jgi:hypothetical protein